MKDNLIRRPSSFSFSSGRLKGLLILLLLTLASPVSGQEPPPVADAAVTQDTAVEPRQAGEDDPSPNPDDDWIDEITGLHEQSIYIPYEKLQEVFEREGRGVFLTYDKFQQLWQAAQKSRQEPTVEDRPIGAIIQQIDSVAQIDSAVVVVDATLKIEVPNARWNEVPLRLAGSAIRAATIDDQPARIVFDDAQGYQLIVENPTEQPQLIELRLKYLKAFQKSPGTSSISIAAPQATINRWTIEVPESGMDVSVEPMIAATRVVDDSQELPQAKIEAFVGAAEQVRLSWNQRSEGAEGLEAFATVRAEQQLVVGDGVIRTTNMLRYEISRAALSRLSVRIPADQKIANVFDRNVKKWEVTEQDDSQQLDVELFEPATTEQTLWIELERFAEVGDGIELTAPLVEAIDVGRQQGVVVVRLESGLQGETTRRVGLLQLDTSELPASLQSGSWSFAYRYGALPYELALAVRKINPRIRVDERMRLALTPDQVDLRWLATYQIDDSGVFQLAVDIPANYEVQSIIGMAVPDGSSPAVESFHRSGDSETEWQVNLSRRALGRVGLYVELTQSVSDPNLENPTGEASELNFSLPRAVGEFLVHREGALLIDAPEQLRINPTTLTGLRTISFAEAALPARIATPSVPSNQPVLAYAFAAGEASLTLSAERRQPYTTVNQILVSRIESGAIQYEASFYCDIKYSPIRSIRIDLPDEVAASVRETSPAIRGRRLAPPPDDVADGYEAWGFSGESELLNQHVIRLEWQQSIDELGLGSSVDFDLPLLQPAAVDRATGQLISTKSESIDLYPMGEPSGLQPLDPQRDIHPDFQNINAALAFEFVDDWSLTLRATRYELEESKRTSIEKGLIRVVALERGELSVQALYNLRTAKQRIPISLPVGATFDSKPMRINGESVTPERDEAGFLYAPLSNFASGEPLLLELRYSVEGTPNRLMLPEFPEDPAVQKVYLAAYLTPEASLVASRGPWSDERLLVDVGSTDSQEMQNDQELIEWVVGSVQLPISALTTFPIGRNDGYYFSTLRPGNEEADALRLWTINRRLLQGIIFAAVLLVGIPLYRRTIRLQLIFLGALLVGLIMIGVFMPRLALSVFDQALFAGLGIIGIVWVVGHVNALLSWQSTSSRQSSATESGADNNQPETGTADQDANAARQGSAESGSPSGSADATSDSGEEGQS